MQNSVTFHDTVLEALGMALVQLMEHKPFSQISISDLCKVAGVSRSSFYRNFISKEQLLCSYISTLYRNYFREHDIPARIHSSEGIRSFLLPRFQFIKEHRTLYTALSEQNLLYYFFNQTEKDLILLLCGQSSNISPYHRAMLSGSCAGIIRCWIENNFQESEEDLVLLFEHPLSR